MSSLTSRKMASCGDSPGAILPESVSQVAGVICDTIRAFEHQDFVVLVDYSQNNSDLEITNVIFFAAIFDSGGDFFAEALV